MAAGSSEWVIVTGACGSLGLAIASHFAAAGHRVLGLDKVSSKGSELEPTGIQFRQVDLTSEAQLTQCIDTCLAPGERVKLLVNAVGAIWSEPILKFQGPKLKPHGLQSWHDVIEANLTAPFAASVAVAARMARQGGGVIINFSSVVASGNIGQAAYSAAKAGLESLTRTMAAELGALGIRVNAIAPGFIDVASTHSALSDAQLKGLTERTASRRLGRVDEIVAAVEFLAGNEFVNGAVLDVDGGIRL